VLAWRRASGGVGDLRLYALVQFYPMLAVPVTAWLLPSR
jgi:hypothetical protein